MVDAYLMDAAIIIGKECKEHFNEPMMVLGVIYIFSIILFSGLLFYEIYNNKNFTNFIKKNNLEKKFQEYKKNNKGLM